MTAPAPAFLQTEVVHTVSAHGRIRDQVIIGAILAALWAVAGTELLSLIRGLSFWPLLIWWSAPVLWLFAILIRRRPRVPDLTLRPPKDWLLVTICMAVALILGTTFVVAVSTPPNNVDALQYHLPRQVYWMQQGHVGFFPASDLRQIVMPPLAEYMGVQLMILSGGDRWLNLISWLALVLSALTASAIARDLGCNARLQALAGLLVVTVPVAALQATNMKNDTLSGFFALAAIFFALKLYFLLRPASGAVHSDSIHLALLALIGASLGLLVLTKSSGVLFGFPVALWIGVLLLRRCNWVRASAYGVAIVAVALALNAGHFVRMSREFGSPIWLPKEPSQQGSINWGTLVNTDRRPKAFVSNVIRNTTMHLATGNRAMDGLLRRAVTSAHKWLGIDLNDPRTTFSAGSRFDITPILTNENRARAPIHVLLGLFAVPLIVSGFRRKTDPWVIALMCTPYLGFLLFCYFLAWQGWHSRLHTPVLFSLCPFLVYTLRMRFETILYSAGGVAMVLAMYAVGFSYFKPIFGESNIFTMSRNQLRFTPRWRHDPNLLRDVSLISGALKPKVVGIQTSWFEYPLQSAFLDSVPPPRLIQLKPQFVPRRRWPVTQPVPDLVINWGADHPKKLKLGADYEYLLADEHSELAVYLPPGQSLPRGIPLRKSAFAGWCSLENIGPGEGPYRNLPVVRWGLGPSSRLQFLSDGGIKHLILDCRRNDYTNQQMTIEINGTSLTNLAFGPALEFKEWVVPIHTVPGTNEVTIRYSTWQEAGSSQPLAVLYKKLMLE